LVALRDLDPARSIAHRGNLGRGRFDALAMRMQFVLLTQIKPSRRIFGYP